MQPVESFAKLDALREARTGFPEAVFAQGKEPAHLAGLMRQALEDGRPLFATRLEPDAEALLRAALAPLPRFAEGYVYHKTARIASLFGPTPPPDDGASPLVSVLTGGTADLRVAEEAAVTLELTGVRPRRVFDVGVAGLDRLLREVEALRESHVIIAVAGMEGALPSVVAGLVDCPVIAVPTSVGYGAHMDGLVPLLAMVNGCAPGVAVTNVDNGFGAAAMACKILGVAERRTPSAPPS